MRMADLLSHFPGRGPGALAALLLGSLALHAARLPAQPATPPAPAAAGNDVLVTVQETNTGSLLFGAGVNSDAGLTGSVVLNERNFDLTRPPTCLEDLLDGAAFRGAGQEFRIEPVPGTWLQRYGIHFRDR
jgi:outer membrane protein assembly factor BamA